MTCQTTYAYKQELKKTVNFYVLYDSNQEGNYRITSSAFSAFVSVITPTAAFATSIIKMTCGNQELIKQFLMGNHHSSATLPFLNAIVPMEIIKRLQRKCYQKYQKQVEDWNYVYGDWSIFHLVFQDFFTRQFK